MRGKNTHYRNFHGTCARSEQRYGKLTQDFENHGKETLRVGVSKPFPVKDQTVSRFGFAGHVVTVTTTQLCHCSTKQPRTIHKQ